MKQCMDIPRGWQRVIKSQTVIYITPSSDELKSKDDILQYLTSPGTCKCGLQCPLHLDSLFSFDASIKAKDTLERTSSGEKYGKIHSSPYQTNETVKGPPITHSCNLRPVKAKKSEGTKVSQNLTSGNSVKRVPSNNSNDSTKDCTKSSETPIVKKPVVDGNYGPAMGNRLPPISIFCQANRYTVHQILQLLYSSLEKRTQKLRSPLKQIQNPDVNVHKDVPKPSTATVSNNNTKNVSHPNHLPRADVRPNAGSSNVQYRHEVPHSKPTEQQNNVRSVPSSFPKSHRDVSVPQKLPPVSELMNNKESSKSVSDALCKKTLDKLSNKDRNIDPEYSKQKAKPDKSSGNMLQIVQSEPNRGYVNQNNVWPPPYAQNTPMHPAMSRYPSNYYAMNQQAFNQAHAFQQHAMNQQAMLRMQGFNPAYGHPPMIRPYNEQEDKRPKSKPKSKSKQPPKVSKQPAIVIQPDKNKVRIDSSSLKPTLLVSLGDNGEKKGTSKCPKPPNDHNLTSVDSILKTCSNPNLGNIPDIDDEVKTPATVASSSQFSNSMIPVQYLTPTSVIYGVPLIQNEPRQSRDSKSSKTVEKWEGVLSPSEVDAKVQQILSSPQKSDEPSQSVEKEGSPKKRKRQQSAPHMFDRYPGNPALRFQTGNTMKAAKLSKSEPHTPSNIVLSSAGNIPVVQNVSVSPMPIGHPHWGQLPPSASGQLPFPAVHPLTGHISQLPDLGSQVEGRKSN